MSRIVFSTEDKGKTCLRLKHVASGLQECCEEDHGGRYVNSEQRAVCSDVCRTFYIMLAENSTQTWSCY